MDYIKIKPATVALGITANAISIQVLTIDLPPSNFWLNAKLYNHYITGEGDDAVEHYDEVVNIPFQLPVSDYNNWSDDAELIDKCLIKLGLEHE